MNSFGCLSGHLLHHLSVFFVGVGYHHLYKSRASTKTEYLTAMWTPLYKQYTHPFSTSIDHDLDSWIGGFFCCHNVPIKIKETSPKKDLLL